MVCMYRELLEPSTVQTAHLSCYFPHDSLNLHTHGGRFRSLCGALDKYLATYSWTEMNAGVISPPLAAEKTQLTTAQLRGLGDKPTSHTHTNTHTLISQTLTHMTRLDPKRNWNTETLFHRSAVVRSLDRFQPTHALFELRLKVKWAFDLSDPSSRQASPSWPRAKPEPLDSQLIRSPNRRQAAREPNAKSSRSPRSSASCGQTQRSAGRERQHSWSVHSRVRVDIHLFHYIHHIHQRSCVCRL